MILIIQLRFFLRTVSLILKLQHLRLLAMQLNGNNINVLTVNCLFIGMAFLLDSNLIIYSYSNEYEYLRDLIIDGSCIVSEISRVEVLGYHALKKEE